MKKIKYTLIAAIVLFTCIVTFAAVPGLRKAFRSSAPEAVPTPAAFVPPVYDARADSLFGKLASLYNRVGELQQWMAEGSISVKDQADSSRSIKLRFRYCHIDSVSYYQLGEQEMLSVPGLYLSVDHGIKKIMMSPREQAPSGFKLFIDDKQIEALKGEGYAINSESSDPYTVIRLRREKHISCREYRVAYDTSGFIRRIFMRSANEIYPENLALDKLISIQIHTWKTTVLPEQLLKVSRYIRKDGDGWIPAVALDNYEIKYIF